MCQKLMKHFFYREVVFLNQHKNEAKAIKSQNHQTESDMRKCDAELLHSHYHLEMREE